MAGMLPGVESARRRRLWSDSPSTIAAPNSTRRSCFCLYSSKHESLISSSSLLERNILYKARPDEELEEAVREAKERLDERFRAKSTRQTSKEKKKKKKKSTEGKPKALEELYFGSRMFSGSKMSSRAPDLDDCALCLESFRCVWGRGGEWKEKK